MKIQIALIIMIKVLVSEAQRPANTVFLSDSDSLLGKLERAQKKYYDEHPKAYRWTGSVAQISTFMQVCLAGGFNESQCTDMLNKQYIDVVLPTRYEDPIIYAIITDIKVRIESQIKATTKQSIYAVIGSLPLYSLNARTYASDHGNNLVVVNCGLPNFVHEMSKILLETVIFETERNTIEISYPANFLELSPKDSNFILIRFSKALEDYSNKRQIKPQASVKALLQNLTAAMVDAMEFFVLAHEYGHLVCNHSSVGPHYYQKEDVDDQFNSASFPLNTNSWNDEMEADLFSIYLFEKYIHAKYSSQKDEIDFYSLLMNVPRLLFSLSDIAESSKLVYIEKKKLAPIDSSLLRNQIYFCRGQISEILQKSKYSFLKVLKLAPYRSVGNPATYLPNHEFVASCHPPSLVRKEYIDLVMTSSFKNKNDSKWSDLSEQLEENLWTMWSSLLPILYKINGKER